MTSVSIDRVISKVIRDSRIADSSYFADMYEWIPEAMRLLRTQVELKPTWWELQVEFHQAHLPCGVNELEAVEYQGMRLGYYRGQKHVSRLSQRTSTNNSFITVPVAKPMPSGNVLDTTAIQLKSVHPTAGYQIHMDWISTTFESGTIIVYGKEMQHDERGLPLIPDHPDYKEALYWYVRSKLIQSGYTDPMYGHDDSKAWMRFELHAARAISNITYPSVDQKEAQLNGQVRFIPPVDYYDSFFNTQLQEPLYGMKGPEFPNNGSFLSDNTPTSALDLGNG